MSRPATRSAVVPAAALALAVSAAAWSAARDPREADEPSARSDPSGRLFYTHQRHAGQVDDCEACHRYAEGDPAPGASVPAPDFARPEEMDCLMCHPFVHPPPGEVRAGPDGPECGLCHPVDGGGKVALPAVQPREPSLRFDHREHFDASGAGCRACHDEAQADTGAPPGMRRCMTCHTGALEGECGRCHLADVRGLLRLELPRGKRLIPPDWMGVLAHGPAFDVTHGPAARSRGGVCARCHEETFCQGCHLGMAVESRFHGAGWMSVHGAGSRTSDLDCEGCHRGQETCLTCHRRSGAALDSPEIGRGVPRGTWYHPADWRSDRAIHGREARRSLLACVSCHAERDCLSCHAVGVNPHGPGFHGRCRDLLEVSAAMCRRCHTVAIPPCD